MKGLRREAIARAAASQTFGIILGTLGRQGNPAIVQRIQTALAKAGKRHFVVLLSEITPAKLALLSSSASSSSSAVDCWVQVACPRLSVDWGHCLSSEKIPVLSPYELFVCLQKTEWKDAYPMDYYSSSGGPWTNYYETNKERQFLLRRDDVSSVASEH
jgi:2-(3-amino-3-carboxypropyl)histidine synthase